MKKILAFGLSLFMALMPMSAFACDITEEQIKNGATCPDDEIAIEDSGRFMAEAEKLDIDTKINSSAFFAGNEINDKAEVKNGIDFSAGNLINLAGQYEYGAHAGNEINISGVYEKDFFALGNVINIEKTAKIGRDIYVAGNSLNIDANIPGSVFFAGNEIVVDSVKIDGDLVVAAQKVVFKGDVEVAGVFKYNDDLKIEGSAKYGTEESYHLPQVNLNPITTTMFSLISGIVTVVLGLLIFKGFSKKVIETTSMDSMEALKTFGIGCVTVIVIPIVSVIMIATLIGIIPGIAVLLGYIAMLLFSTSVTAVVVGEKLIKTKNTMLNASIAVAVISVLVSLPYIGVTIGTIVTIFGFGLMFRIMFKK